MFSINLLNYFIINRLKIFSWNVATSAEPDEITIESLGLPKDPEADSIEIPHIYVVGFQEVKALSHFIFEDPLVQKLRKLLAPYGFVKLISEKMQGILLTIFVHRDISYYMRNFEKDFVRTGYRGYWGNKGAVAIRFSFPQPDVHFCIVNAHLAAHDDKLEQRIQDYHSIMDQIKFKKEKFKYIENHNEIFFFGDLNFRINNLTGEEIVARIEDGSEKSRIHLLNHDQLNQVRSEGRAFQIFRESSISFWPTYKFIPKTNNYDLKRKPAYTDRILYKGFSTAISGYMYCPASDKNCTSVLDYKRHMDFFSSDHKPISAHFITHFEGEDESSYRSHRALLSQEENDEEKTLSNEYFVAFEPIEQWKNDEENNVTFSFRDHNSHLSLNFISSHDRTYDWIGIYHENFNDIDNYICYITTQLATVNEETIQIPYPHLTSIINCSLPINSSYVLIYFHDSESRSILGISDPFNVTI